MNEVLMGDWVDEVWLKRNNPASSQESGLIYDSAKCHLTEMAKNATQSSAHIAVIPGGLTKKLQPLDISVNRSFKCHLRQQWENWMLNNAVHTFTPGGKMRHASLVEVCQWVITSWEAVTAECIQNGFRKALNENEDEESEENENIEESDGESEDIEEDNLGELEALPNDLVDAFDDFHFISDDDFDGFNENE